MREEPGSEPSLCPGSSQDATLWQPHLRVDTLVKALESVWTWLEGRSELKDRVKGQPACPLTLEVDLLILSLAAVTPVIETVTFTHRSGTEPTTGGCMDTDGRKASQSVFVSRGQLI